MHRWAGSYSGLRENPYGPSTLTAWLADLGQRQLESDVRIAVLRAAGAIDEASKPLGLPRGAIHADLFRDNVKWLADRIAAVIDFEMACVDELALDLGITLIVWTFGVDSFDRPRVRSLIEGYQSERKLLAEEKAGLWSKCLYGAIRYTLSRIRDFHLAAVGTDALERKPWQRYAQRMGELLRLGAAGFGELCGL
jgi:homoserine kinase type II